MEVGAQLDRLLGKFLSAAGKKGLQDVLSVDFDSRGSACVRMRKTGDEIEVVHADILPPVALNAGDETAPEARKQFSLPRNMVARHVAVCVPDDRAIVKLLSFPGDLNRDAEGQIRTLMGVEEGVHRISYKVLGRTQSRLPETKLLTLALPEPLVIEGLAMFPVGVPAPVSVEARGLAVMSAFLRRPDRRPPDTAVGVIELGARSTLLAFFYRDQLVLVRQFDFGSSHILEAVQNNLGVDGETVKNIISDGSFDISELIKGVAEPFIKQLVISRHFVERREGCHIASVYVPMGAPPDWLNEVRSAMGVDVVPWDPFEGLGLLSEAVSEEHKASASMFSAAVGAGLSVLEESSV